MRDTRRHLPASGYPPLMPAAKVPPRSIAVALGLAARGPPHGLARPGTVMRPAPPGTGTRPLLVMVAITGISALCFVAIKAGLGSAPLLFAGLRTLIGGAALLGLAAARRRPILPTRRDWPWILALAPVTTTLTYGAMFLSAGRTGAGIAAVLGNLQPLLAIALAAAVLGERIARRTGVALGLGLGGVALIAWPALTGPGAYGRCSRSWRRPGGPSAAC